MTEQFYGSKGATRCTENKISRWMMKAQEQRLVGDAKKEVTSEKREAGAGACAGAAAIDCDTMR
jgi:hypothetical protein